MIDEQTLQEVVKRIVAAAQPSRVILFGSYGRGDADVGPLHATSSLPRVSRCRRHQG